jgi:hypothetical protein
MLTASSPELQSCIRAYDMFSLSRGCMKTSLADLVDDKCPPLSSDRNWI